MHGRASWIELDGQTCELKAYVDSRRLHGRYRLLISWLPLTTQDRFCLTDWLDWVLFSTTTPSRQASFHQAIELWLPTENEGLSLALENYAAD